MLDISLYSQFIILIVLLLISAFFSMCETAMMAANKFRLNHKAKNENNKGAKLAINLLNQTDKLLGVILLGNNLVNTAAATLVSLIAVELFGANEFALAIGTLLITFIILVCSEITPKIIGAKYADNLAVIFAYLLTPLLKLVYPIVWFINLFATGLLKCIFFIPNLISKYKNGNKNNNKTDDANKLTPEEIKSLVLEAAHQMPNQHKTILNSLFDLNQIRVEDIMRQRKYIEYIDIADSIDDIKKQIINCPFSRLPICQNSLDKLLGILPIRKVLNIINTAELTKENLLKIMHTPYYIPLGTPIFSQLSFFRENHRRTGVIVDEYGEIIGLVSLTDIVEELVGDFVFQFPGLPNQLKWSANGEVVIEGNTSLRELNRHLGLNFPTENYKTINGLITSYLEEIPEGELCLILCGTKIEILHTENKSVITLKLFKN
ncbi:MAG: HlyC/CorC family transporter [Rhodocyclaceae bacterium]